MSGHVGRSPFLNWYFIEKPMASQILISLVSGPLAPPKGKHRFLCSNKNTFGWFRNVSHLLRCQSTKVGRTSFFPLCIKDLIHAKCCRNSPNAAGKSWRFGSDHVPFFSWVICRVPAVNLPGCILPQQLSTTAWADHTFYDQPCLFFCQIWALLSGVGQSHAWLSSQLAAKIIHI